jgi:phospholipase/carboxylesterase
MSSFVHHFEPGTDSAPALLLLHGTGGDEHDLVPVGQAIAPGASLLSPRGKVLEHGMPRFFRRLAEGVFDEEDVRRRADELADFVEHARVRYGLPAPIALGYSNGANIAAAVLLQRPQTLSGAILLRAMVPLAQAPQADLAGQRVLIISGAHDPIIPLDNAKRLAKLLKDAGASVAHHVLPVGHGLSNDDIALAQEWMAEIVGTQNDAAAGAIGS